MIIVIVIVIGQQIISAKGYDTLSIGACAGALILYIVATRILGYIALRYVKM